MSVSHQLTAAGTRYSEPATREEAHMGEGIYIAKRNGHCQHCGHHFFSSSPTPGTLCFHCKTSAVVQAKMQAQIDATRGCADSAQPEPITWAGRTVDAPNFSQDQFDRAMGRAFIDELQIKPHTQAGRYVVGHRNGHCYVVSRERCSCRAGSSGTPCKHRAILIAHLD